MKTTQLKIFFADSSFISIIQSFITLNHDLYVGFRGVNEKINQSYFSIKLNVVNMLRV